MARPLDTALDYVSCRTLLWGLGVATIGTALKTGLQAGNGVMWGWWLVLALLFAGLWTYTWFYCGRDEAGGRRALEREQRKGVSVAAGGTALAVDSAGAGRSRTNVGVPSDKGQAHWSQSGKHAVEVPGTVAGNRAETAQRDGLSSSSSTSSGEEMSANAATGSHSGTSAAPSVEGAAVAAISSMPDVGHQEASIDVRTGQDSAKTSSKSAASAVDDMSDTGRPSTKPVRPTDKSEDLNKASATGHGTSGPGDPGKEQPCGQSDPADNAAPSTIGATTATSATDGDAGGQTDDAVGGIPAALKEARNGNADDLKRISGVGPKLEGLLNELGFFHFDQIAQWTEENVAWVDDHLGFKGRITRDDWIGQAKKLAAEE